GSGVRGGGCRCLGDRPLRGPASDAGPRGRRRSSRGGLGGGAMNVVLILALTLPGIGVLATVAVPSRRAGTVLAGIDAAAAGAWAVVTLGGGATVGRFHAPPMVGAAAAGAALVGAAVSHRRRLEQVLPVGLAGGAVRGRPVDALLLIGASAIAVRIAGAFTGPNAPQGVARDGMVPILALGLGAAAVAAALTSRPPVPVALLAIAALAGPTADVGAAVLLAAAAVLCVLSTSPLAVAAAVPGAVAMAASLR